MGDAEALKEYNRILDAQEEARAAELQARMDKQKDLMEKMKENVVKQQQAKGDEDAKRAQKQKEERDLATWRWSGTSRRSCGRCGWRPKTSFSRKWRKRRRA